MGKATKKPVKVNATKAAQAASAQPVSEEQAAVMAPSGGANAAPASDAAQGKADGQVEATLEARLAEVTIAVLNNKGKRVERPATLGDVVAQSDNDGVCRCVLVDGSKHCFEVTA